MYDPLVLFLLACIFFVLGIAIHHTASLLSTIIRHAYKDWKDTSE
jgi:hypothetical protein